MKQPIALFLALLFVAPTVSAKAQTAESCSTTSGLCWPKLKRGASSEKVRTLQILLHSRGFRVARDGRFGSSTDSAVRSFQKQK
ncbi:Putative peptidoglycan binding domain-containing protein [Abditibacterium utsteinense]|uniref:Peptidoglycan binding domain-containing protein n=1 Tax=Abditibacterium utsteinense TaxID=1960156 RepID=A0A2S8SWZ2_9BACT|nr:Putative peptidoglycan binding domain-containing protein [Abditibacterium utsteinense]